MLKSICHIVLLLPFFGPTPHIGSIHLSGHAQGTTWNIIYFGSDSIAVKNAVDSIFNSIDSSLSIYKPFSTITAFNKSERGIRVDHHLQKIVKLSFEFTKLTKGLSDITVGPLTQAYGFGAKKPDSLPNKQQLEKLRECVGMKNIIFRNDSLIKKKPCVLLDVNGIAQGYTVDIIGGYLEHIGIRNYLVEVGGELRSKGTKSPGNQPFQAGIESPSDDEFDITPMQQIISLRNSALTTSGNYRKYYESNGKKHSHILDPRNGLSVDNEMISATVWAKDATTADALDNALMLMGVEKGIAFVNRMPGVAAFFIYKNAKGYVTDTASTRFKILIDQSNKK